MYLPGLMPFGLFSGSKVLPPILFSVPKTSVFLLALAVPKTYVLCDVVRSRFHSECYGITGWVIIANCQ